MATGIVLVVVVYSKFTIGAWVPVVVIPIIILLFKGVKRHYQQVSEALMVPDDWRPPRLNHTVVVLVGGVHRGVLEALAYARSLAPNHLVAVTVVSDEEEQSASRSSGRPGVSTSPSTSSTPPTGSSPGPCSASSTRSTSAGRTTSSPC